MQSQAQSQDTSIFRRATTDDFQAIYAIWMQDHVIPFMTFEQMPEQDFKPIFDTLMQQSEIYVIENNRRIVATRRIIPGSGEHAHSVELASFCVAKDSQRNGYGTRFYEFLITKIKSDMPHVKRIELGQETDNDVALKLAQKMGFKAEVIFPDWIRRKTGPKIYTCKWNMGARFMALMLDSQPSLTNVQPYLAHMPDNKTANDMHDCKIEIHSENKNAVCYYNNKIIGVCHFSQGVRRFEHIQFWDIQLEQDCNLQAMETCLRQLAALASQHSKKIEIFIADKDISQLAENLGFHCRGMKTGSRKIGEEYYDEIGVELSFFNVQDAMELLAISVTESYPLLRIKNALHKCQEAIQHAHSEQQIDPYKMLYLENMAFQMVREGVGEIAIKRYGQQNQPWNTLINQLPETLQESFIQLDALTTKTYTNELNQQHSKQRNFTC